MKKKLPVGLIVLLMSFYIGELLAVIVDQSLRNGSVHLIWNPCVLTKTILADRQMMIFTGLFFSITLLGIFTLFFTGTTNTYKSDLMEITPDIKTPVPAGQGQYGTARWLTKKEIDRTFDHVVIEKDKLLGHDVRLEAGGLVIGKKDLKKGKEAIYHITADRHSLNIGATRSGKTRCLALQTIVDLMLAGENIFVTDMKKELYDYTSDTAKKLGYHTIRLDFIDPYQSDRRNYLEPVIRQLKKHDISKAIEETWSLTSQLVGEPPQNGEKLWNNGEASILAASIMAVCYDNMDRLRYQNLTNVFYFITEMCQDYRGGLPLEFYIKDLPESHPSRGLLSATKLAAFKTRSSFYVSAVMTLKLLTMPSINQMTCTSDFDLEEMINNNEKVILYLCLPARDETYFPLASLFLRQITDEIDRLADEHGGRVPRRWNFIEDEFGNFTKITNITSQTSFGTGKGIRHNFFIQSYAQLDEKYGKEVAQIIRDNCDITIYLRSPNQTTREEISKDLDSYTVSSYSINNNMQMGTMTGQGSRGESTNLIKRELLTAEEVGRIKRPYSLVMSDTHPAVMYAPDLSQWAFNDLLGLGDEDFNLALRARKKEEQKQKERPHDETVHLWGIWKVYQEKIDEMIEEQQSKKGM